MRAWIRIASCSLLGLALATAAETRWSRIATSNFEMYTTAGERSARETIQYFEQVRGFFAQTMPRASEEPAQVRIVAFSSTKEYEPYRLNDFATAYYHSTADHDYIVMSHTGAETFPTAIHEYVHLIVRHSKLNLPPWLNEGIAELYSTLKPLGDKILVGSLIPGRHQALLQEKWVPLTIILGAGHDSAYYNEKDKAGSLYNEGWALTHMLALSNEYRSGFSRLVNSISNGTPSANALEEVYGKPLKQIEADLNSYLRGGRFQGVLIPAKLEKDKQDLRAEVASDFDVKLLLSEVSDRPARAQATRKTLEELIAQDQNRPEPHVDMAYLDWRENRSSEARDQFAKAFELGSRNSRMLWDYGRMAESDAGKSIAALAELLKQEPNRLEVRLELASVQLRSNAAKDALQTLAPVKKVTPEDAPKLLTLLAYANLETGDRATALNTAVQLQTVSKTQEDRDQADRLLKFIQGAQSGGRTPAIAFSDTAGPPALAHRDAEPEPPARPIVRRPSFAGRFVELQCSAQGTMVLETPEGKKSLIIDDPTKLLVNGKSGETMDLSCGPQKPIQVRVEYDPPSQNRAGVDGVVRGIYFDP